MLCNVSHLLLFREHLYLHLLLFRQGHEIVKNILLAVLAQPEIFRLLNKRKVGSVNGSVAAVSARPDAVKVGII